MLWQVYREWTVNREALLTERPKRISIAPALASFELLPSPIKGAWPAELLDMLQSKIELPLPGIQSGSCVTAIKAALDPKMASCPEGVSGR